MNLNLNTIYDRLRDIDYTAQKLMKESGIDPEDGRLGGVCPEHFTPDEVFMLSTAITLLEPLQEIHHTLGYLSRPTHGVYRLSLMSGGKYGYVDNRGLTHLFSSGFPFEALLTEDSPSGMPEWVPVRVEYGQDGYYLFGHRKTSLEGLKVRERW